jgi:hypothetical protein
LTALSAPPRREATTSIFLFLVVSGLTCGPTTAAALGPFELPQRRRTG